MKSLKEITDILVELLIENGIRVQRYDSMTTNSYYLKLDFGLCNSIRISDHEGKKYLKYRYNLGSFIKEYKMVYDGWARHYYPLARYEALSDQIISDRHRKLESYGIDRYQTQMEIIKQRNSGKRGFWKDAKFAFIKDGEVKYEREELI